MKRKKVKELGKRIKLLNLPVDIYNMTEAISIVQKYIENGKKPHCVFASNPEKNFSIQKDKILKDTFEKADLLIPDGIGIVISAKILKNKAISRVPGIELMEKICKLAAIKGYRIFVYGASEEVNKKAVKVIKKKYKGIIIAGRSNGYIKNDGMDKLIRKINDSKAEILFIAMGSPKQEKWYAEHKQKLANVRLCQGIGGSLDVFAGKVKRAPYWWRKNNIEWLYRLIKEPKRIKRQKILPIFFIKVILSKISNEINILKYEKRREKL